MKFWNKEEKLEPSLSIKLNPVQSQIALGEGSQLPFNTWSQEQAYQQIDVIHRAVGMIINASVEIPFLVDNKNLEKLLNVKPNPFEDRVRFFRRAFLDFIINGNCFLFYDVIENQLYLLPAKNIKVIPDAKTFIQAYEYTSGIGKPKKFSPEEIIHIKDDAADGIYLGESRLKALSKLITLYYHMIGFQSQFFANNAIPGLVLKTDNTLSQKMKDRMLESWTKLYSHINNGARKPAILDGGLEVANLGENSFTELDFEKSIERIQADLANGLGVPYLLIKSGNNANIQPNLSVFYLTTVLPLLEQFASAMSLRFGVPIQPDKESIDALRAPRAQEQAYFTGLVNGGILTPNEARAGLRYPALPGAENDQIRVPQNIAGSALDASQGGRPQGDNQQ